MRCCVPGCGQYSQKGISFHRFPQRDKKITQKWVDQIHAYLDKHNCEHGRLKRGKVSVLCSNHFLESDYFVTPCNRTLKLSAYPSIFSCDPNAPRQRKNYSELTVTPPVPQLRYILPKVKIDKQKSTKLESTKIIVTENEVENRENNFGKHAALELRPQESEEIFTPQESEEIFTPQESEEIFTPQESEEILTWQIPYPTGNSGEHAALGFTSQESEEIFTPQESEEIFKPQESEEILTPQESEEILTPQDSEKVITPQESEEIFIPQESEEIFTPQESEEIAVEGISPQLCFIPLGYITIT